MSRFVYTNYNNETVRPQARSTPPDPRLLDFSIPQPDHRGVTTVSTSKATEMLVQEMRNIFQSGMPRMIPPTQHTSQNRGPPPLYNSITRANFNPSQPRGPVPGGPPPLLNAALRQSVGQPPPAHSNTRSLPPPAHSKSASRHHTVIPPVPQVMPAANQNSNQYCSDNTIRVTNPFDTEPEPVSRSSTHLTVGPWSIGSLPSMGAMSNSSMYTGPMIPPHHSHLHNNPGYQIMDQRLVHPAFFQANFGLPGHFRPDLRHQLQTRSTPPLNQSNMFSEFNIPPKQPTISNPREITLSSCPSNDPVPSDKEIMGRWYKPPDEANQSDQTSHKLLTKNNGKDPSAVVDDILREVVKKESCLNLEEGRIHRPSKQVSHTSLETVLNKLNKKNNAPSGILPSSQVTTENTIVEEGNQQQPELGSARTEKTLDDGDTVCHGADNDGIGLCILNSYSLAPAAEDDITTASDSIDHETTHSDQNSRSSSKQGRKSLSPRKVPPLKIKLPFSGSNKRKAVGKIWKPPLSPQKKSVNKKPLEIRKPLVFTKDTTNQGVMLESIDIPKQQNISLTVGKQSTPPQKSNVLEKSLSAAEKPQKSDLQEKILSPAEKPQKSDLQEKSVSPDEKPEKSEVPKKSPSPAEKPQKSEVPKKSPSPAEKPKAHQPTSEVPGKSLSDVVNKVKQKRQRRRSALLLDASGNVESSGSDSVRNEKQNKKELNEIHSQKDLTKKTSMKASNNEKVSQETECNKVIGKGNCALEKNSDKQNNSINKVEKNREFIEKNWSQIEAKLKLVEPHMKNKSPTKKESPQKESISPKPKVNSKRQSNEEISTITGKRRHLEDEETSPKITDKTKHLEDKKISPRTTEKRKRIDKDDTSPKIAEKRKRIDKDETSPKIPDKRKDTEKDETCLIVTDEKRQVEINHVANDGKEIAKGPKADDSSQISVSDTKGSSNSKPLCRNNTVSKEKESLSESNNNTLDDQLCQREGSSSSQKAKIQTSTPQEDKAHVSAPHKDNQSLYLGDKQLDAEDKEKTERCNDITRMISTITHPAFFVTFHGQRVLCLHSLFGKLLLMREILRRNFKSLDCKDGFGRNCNQANFKYVYLAKERDLKISYREIPDEHKQLSVKYLQAEKLIKGPKVPMHLGVITVEDALRLYHYMNGLKKCPENCIEIWAPDSVGEAAPQNDSELKPDCVDQTVTQDEKLNIGELNVSVTKENSGKEDIPIVNNSSSNKMEKNSTDDGRDSTNSIPKRKQGCGSHLVTKEKDGYETDETIVYEEETPDQTSASSSQSMDISPDEDKMVLRGGVAECYGSFFRYIVVEGEKFYPYEDLVLKFGKIALTTALQSRLPEKFRAYKCTEVEADFINKLEESLPVLNIEATLLEEALFKQVASSREMLHENSVVDLTDNDDDIQIVDSNDNKTEDKEYKEDMCDNCEENEADMNELDDSIMEISLDSPVSDEEHIPELILDNTNIETVRKVEKDNTANLNGKDEISSVTSKNNCVKSDVSTPIETKTSSDSSPKPSDKVSAEQENNRTNNVKAACDSTSHIGILGEMSSNILTKCLEDNNNERDSNSPSSAAGIGNNLFAERLKSMLSEFESQLQGEGELSSEEEIAKVSEMQKMIEEAMNGLARDLSKGSGNDQSDPLRQMLVVCMESYNNSRHQMVDTFMKMWKQGVLYRAKFSALEKELNAFRTGTEKTITKCEKYEEMLNKLKQNIGENK